jgi:hypothetical protein
MYLMYSNLCALRNSLILVRPYFLPLLGSIVLPDGYNIQYCNFVFECGNYCFTFSKECNLMVFVRNREGRKLSCFRVC